MQIKLHRPALLLVATLFLTFIFSRPLAHAQAGDCPYPVIFMHGWNSGHGAWSPLYDDGDFRNVWGSLSVNDHVFWAVVNATDTHEYNACCSALCWFTNCLNDNTRNDDLNGPDGVFNGTGSGDDVQWVFPNENNVLSSGCLYAYSFNNGKYDNGNIDRDDADLFGGSDSPCGDCSDSNESAIFKQGYAVKQVIAAVLAANPTKEKVIIVGHSMGGLAGREYLQRTDGTGNPRWWIDPSSPDGHKVAKYVSAGTPHRGSNTFEFFTEPQAEEEKDGLPDIWSEAVRDLRYRYGENDNPGVYLYGGPETNVPFNAYWSEDVNCDGSRYSVVTGINEAGSPGWDGTRDNPAMPLPTNVRYTYYVSNEIGGILSTCKYQYYGCAGDGVVDDQRQWLYAGSGQGRTEDHIDKVNWPVPYDGVANRLSDRVTGEYGVFHTSQSGDVRHMVRTLDEGDYPKFAWDLDMNTTYAGMATMPPEVLPGDGNRTSEDHDWYVFELPASGRGIKIRVTPTANLSGRIDFYDAPGDYEIADSKNYLSFSASASPTEKVLKAVGCFSPGTKYYVRVTHNGVGENNWKSPFRITVEANTVKIPTTVNLYTATGETTTSDGWTHFWKDASAAPVTTDDLLLLSVKKDATVVISPAEVQHGVNAIGGYSDLSAAAYVPPGESWFTMNRYWNVTPTTQPGAGGVDVRFYYMTYDFEDVQAQANANGGGVGAPQDLVFYKFATGAGVDPDPSQGHTGGTTENFLTPLHLHSSACIADNYAEIHVTGFSGGGGGGGAAALPVELLSFDGKASEKGILLNWITATEENNSHFEIQRSPDGRFFNRIGRVEGALNSIKEIQYDFLDENPEKGINYYRLRIVDTDGKATFSPVISVEHGAGVFAVNSIFPVPFSKHLNLSVFAPEKNSVRVKIFNAIGQTIQEDQREVAAGEQVLTLDLAHLSKGLYYIQLNYEDKMVTRRFVKE